MTDEDRLALRTISVLLQYPEEEPPDNSRRELPLNPQVQEQWEAFWKYRKATPLRRLREDYTRTFDLDPSASLNLTVHMKRRASGGNPLLDLQALYKGAGWENITRELPDYLPLVLEYLTICPEEDARWISREYGGTVALLASRLKESANPYAGLLQAAAEVLQRNRGEDEPL